MSPVEPLAMSGGILGCQNLVGGDAAGLWWVEDRDAAKHPIIHRTAPTKRITWLKMAIVPRLKNPELKGSDYKKHKLKLAQ